jgi:hypothetical protein
MKATKYTIVKTRNRITKSVPPDIPPGFGPGPGPGSGVEVGPGPPRRYIRGIYNVAKYVSDLYSRPNMHNGMII